MHNSPPSYCGIIPFKLYVEFQNSCPQNFNANESDKRWLSRCMNNPGLVRNTFYSPALRNELKSAVANHLMASMGAEPEKEFPRQSRNTYSERYKQDRTTSDDDAAMKMLLAQHKASMNLPENGSVFWNGVNDLALAKLVGEWSEKYPQVYNSLEGSTSVKYINKRFKWGGPVEHFFNESSAQLGLATSGHTTAICRFGLRNDSILTKTELPRMINNMQNQLASNRNPSLTDVTIVVINPIGSQVPFATFTNSQIVDLMTWQNPWPDRAADASKCIDVVPLGKFWKDSGHAKDSTGKSWVSSRAQTKIVLPPDVKLYWQRRTKPAVPQVVSAMTSDDAIKRLFNFNNTIQPRGLPGMFKKRIN